MGFPVQETREATTSRKLGQIPLVKKPQTEDEYRQWFAQEQRVSITNSTQAYYETVTGRAQQEIETSKFWREFVDELTEINARYHIETGYDLIAPGRKLKLLTKSYNSFFQKTFRKNVTMNKNWPNPPENGWMVPDDWLSQTNDIIRGALVVRYLDGVEFMVKEITTLGDKLGHKFKHFYEAREDGYYAAHLYTQYDAEIPKQSWDTHKVSFSIELQVRTELQESIQKLLHSYYKRRGPERERNWQWNFESDEFVANYMGHILHYVEATIVDIRKKLEAEK